jgi:hypothetical protein
MGPIPPPFPNGKGAGRVMAVVVVPSKGTFVSGGISFSPFGETGEGFSCGKMSQSCQSKTSSQVKPSPKKNFNEQKNCGAT